MDWAEQAGAQEPLCCQKETGRPFWAFGMSRPGRTTRANSDGFWERGTPASWSQAAMRPSVSKTAGCGPACTQYAVPTPPQAPERLASTQPSSFHPLKTAHSRLCASSGKIPGKTLPWGRPAEPREELGLASCQPQTLFAFPRKQEARRRCQRGILTWQGHRVFSTRKSETAPSRAKLVQAPLSKPWYPPHLPTTQPVRAQNSRVGHC